MARSQKPAKKRPQPARKRTSGKQPSESSGRRAGRDDEIKGGKTTISSDTHGNSGERETRDRPQQEVHPDDYDYEGT